MKNHSSRRSFLRKTAAASLSVPFVKSLEEYALAAQAELKAHPASAPTKP